jgi:excisionase family DNA binding protein
MPVNITGVTYYRTVEVCHLVGIHRSTLLRWLRDGVIDNRPCRDRRGWRLFSEADVNRIKNEANRIKHPIYSVG